MVRTVTLVVSRSHGVESEDECVSSSIYLFGRVLTLEIKKNSRISSHAYLSLWLQTVRRWDLRHCQRRETSRNPFTALPFSGSAHRMSPAVRIPLQLSTEMDVNSRRRESIKRGPQRVIFCTLPARSYALRGNKDKAGAPSSPADIAAHFSRSTAHDLYHGSGSSPPCIHPS